MELELNNFWAGLYMEKDDTRLRQAWKRAGFKSARATALRFGWTTENNNTSTFGSHENGTTPIPRKDAEKYARALGVTAAWLLYLEDSPTGSSTVKPDGEKVEIDQLEPQLAKRLAVAIAGRRAEVWRLTNPDILAALHYQKGQFLIVDLAKQPEERDLVLAEVSETPIFRMFLPPWLYGLPLKGHVLKTDAYDMQVTIRGVVDPKQPF